ncbi:MAG: NAD-dependent epimerase/dehydratase family protein [Microbacterium sp.]|nr:NAD-dependent epimerase/dehydratase family protein [Microbacterium sp.]
MLVTGASGVAGTALVEVLRTAGYDVSGISSAQGDLRDLSTALAVFEQVQPEAVIHLAGRVHGIAGNTGAQGDMFLDNLQINMNVVEAARRTGARKIVAMGTVAAYPGDVALPMRESDIWSGRPHGAEYGYAQAKRAMLAQLEAYQEQYGLDFAMALSTNLFGPNDRFDEARGHVLPSLISKFHRAVTTGESVVVWGTGAPTRDFLYSFDAARGLQVLLERGSGVYNLASGMIVSIKNVADQLAEVSGYSGEILWDHGKPNGQMRRDYDMSRISELGWGPAVGFREALESTYAWYAGHVQSARR